MSSGIITLNVGGFLYTTMRSTLERAPFIDALLRNMESVGNASVEGNTFIDRDGEAFKDILAFLRSGLPVVAHVPVSILEREADFYGIKGFQALSAPRKLFLPESTKSKDTINGYFHDHARRGQGQKRYRFDVDNLPADIPTHIGSGGVRGCVNENDLAKFGFRLVEKDPTGVVSSDTVSGVEDTSDYDVEELAFERTMTKHYVDMQEFSVPNDGSTWDIVETRELNGQWFAVVTKYN